MHRKPMVSFLIGSLVFGLVLGSISWLPEVSGWQQGTLPGKRPVKRNKRSSQDKTVTKSKATEKALPQPPTPATVDSEVSIREVSTPTARTTIAVFDIVASEPISSKPIGRKEASKKPASEQVVPVKPAQPEVESVLTDELTKPVKPGASVVKEPALESTSPAAIGTAVRPVEQQPVVRSVGSSEAKEPAAVRSRGSLFGIDLELKIPGSEKFQERFKSLVPSNSQKKTTGQGGQAVGSSRRPGNLERQEKGSRSAAAPQTSQPSRVARGTFPFALPPIAIPRLLPMNETEDSTPKDEVSKQGASVSGTGNTTNSKVSESDSPRPLQFRKLTPGRSSAMDLKERFGAPQEQRQENGVEILTYQVGPFQQVKVVVSDKIVDSIQVFFKESYSTQEMATQLGIDEFEPVIVRDSRGKATGSVYPERGVKFVYKRGSDSVRVKQLVLDSISPVPFLQRAQVNQYSHYQDALADLKEVQRLDPKNEAAHAMKAHILMQVGQFKRAMQAIKTAIQLQPESNSYQLIQARIEYRLGQWEAAEETIQVILDDDQVSRIDQAQATCLLGDLYGRQGQRDYRVAIQHHLDGIKQAKSLVGNKDGEVSHHARHILLDTHLAIANDIAWGDWKNKDTVVPKWLDNSELLLESLASHPKEDAALVIHVQQQTLCAYMGMAGEMDGTEVIESLTKSYNELLNRNSDALFKQRVRWMMGSALYYAGRISQQQGKSQEALRHATDGHQLLTTVAAGRDVVASQEILRGNTCFLVGSLHAVDKSDHWEAVNWYERALKKFEPSAVVEGIMNPGLHGERLVSMGLSFWQSGDQQRGLQLTRQGTEMIERAVEKQSYQSQILAVPYGNLVAMYGHLEKGELANEYAERAAKLKQVSEDDATAIEETVEKTESTEEKPAVDEKATSAIKEDSVSKTQEPDPSPSAKSEATEKVEDPKPAEAKLGSEEPAATKPESSEKVKKPSAAKPTVKAVPENPIRKSSKSE